MSFRLVSSILRGAWAIDQGYANANLSLIHSFLNGKIDGKVFRSGAGEYENPFYIDANGNRLKYGEKVPAKSIYVMPVTGVVLKYNGECGEPGMMLRESLLRSADEDPNVSGIMLVIDSPGGEAYGTFSFAEAVRNCKKPTVAFVESGMAASAAFWIASACDQFYCSKAVDEVGSCGVMCTMGDPTGAYEQAGIKIRTVYAPESTEKNLPYRQLMNEDSAALVEKDLSVLAQYFISSIKEYRGNRLKSDAWQKGAMYYAPEALQMGLIDGIKSFDEVLSGLRRVQKISNPVSKSKTNMSKNYSAIASAAGWAEGHESDDNGIFLNHEEAAKIDGMLQQNSDLQAAATKAQGESETATEAQATAEAALETLRADHATELQTVRDAHAAELSAAQNATAELQARYDALAGKPANDGTPVVGDSKAQGADESAPKEYDEVTKQAMEIYNRNQFKK